MILYNVTVKVDLEVHHEWLEWMRTKHIPNVINTGLFHKYHICRLLEQDESDGVTYAIQYYTDTIEKYRLYQKIHAPFLQAEHRQRYENRTVAFRTLLEVIH